MGRVIVCPLVSVLLSTVPGSAGSQPKSAVGQLAELTLEEKAGLTTGRNDWETLDVPRLGIPPAWMADGPVGLRKSTGENVSDSVPATCFPSAAAMAATWNEPLIEELGAGIGREAREHGVSLLLGPGLNLKRHPLGGRNFEYYSEDPRLSGKIAAAFVRGVQSQGVGATLKHFAVNNQEHRRMSIDARVDERTLRELYLRGFEIAVKEGSPQAVMSAYNRVNGISASHHPRLLTEILRDEWGFEGLVVSDWGAVDDPVEAISAGLDLEMPGNPMTPPRVAAAVREGRLEQARLDRAAARVLQLPDRQAALADFEAKEGRAHHELAREVAVESMVLLQNDGLLPLAGGSGEKLGVVGRLAFEPRIQGIGSSQINAREVEPAWPHLEKLGTEKGYDVESWNAPYDEEGLQESERSELGRFLESREVVVVFAGQKASHDAEAWDRPSMSLAPADLELIEAVQSSGRRFAVVLVGGGAVDVRPFYQEAAAILMGWLGGEAFGSAVAEVILGVSTPSGKLSETFAWAVEDHASALNFPGGPLEVRYGEGLYVGYRYFQSYDQEVAYPFGHGLSYTDFEYSEPSAPSRLESLESFEVELQVKNLGPRPGAETVQLYLRQLAPSLPRPDLELVAFRKVRLAPGEAKRVVMELDPRDLAYFSDVHGSWVIEPGDYELLLGSSALDIRAVVPIHVATGTVPATVYTADHTIGDIYGKPQGKVVLDFLLEQAGRGPLSLAGDDPFFAAIFANMPFKKLRNFSQGAIDDTAMQGLLMLINSPFPPEQVRLMLEQSLATQAP